MYSNSVVKFSPPTHFVVLGGGGGGLSVKDSKGWVKVYTLVMC